MIVTPIEPPMPFSCHALKENLFFTDARPNIMWIDPHPNAVNREQENVNNSIQCFCVIYNERSTMEG